MHTVSESEFTLLALRQELVGNPMIVTASQTLRLRALFPHSSDERVSNLPIAELVHGEEWFWTAVGTLAAKHGENIHSSDPNQRWYRDVVKAILVHADAEALVGIDSISGFRWNIEENLRDIARAVRAKSLGDLELYSKILERFWQSRGDSLIGELVLEALEKLESPEAGKLIAHLFSANPVKYFERLKRHHYETKLISSSSYCKSLRKSISLFAESKGTQLAIEIWHEIYTLSPEQIAAWSEEYTSQRIQDRGSGEWAGFYEFLSANVSEPNKTPEVIQALTMTDWLENSEVDRTLDFFGNHSDNRLYGTPCRLAQIRMLRLMLKNFNQTREKFFNEIKDPSRTWCPIHNCAPTDSLAFVSGFLVSSKDSSETLLLTNRFATQRFLALAKTTKEFKVSQRSIDFLTRNETKDLLPWQVAAIASWAAHGRQGIIAAATGTGKSRIGVAAILEAFEDGIPIVLLTHRLAIKGQWKKDELFSTPESDITGFLLEEKSRIFKLGVNVRELSCEDHYSIQDPPAAKPGRVLIALDKSLADRPELLPKEFEPGLLVADEVHQFNDPTGRVILEGSFSRRLGLSATVSGFDDYGLMPYFGGVKVADYPIYKALRDKVISEYNLLTIRVPYSPVQGFGGVTHQKVDLTTRSPFVYSEQDLEEADQRVSTILGEILDPVFGFPIDKNEDFEAVLDRVILAKDPKFMPIAKRYLRARSEYDKITRKFKSQSSVLELIAPKIDTFGRTLVFANTKIQGKELRDDLSDLNVPVTYIDSDTEHFGRKDAFRSLQDNLTRAIIAPQILDEGVNIPNAQIGLFLGKGSGKYRQTVQRMGRVLRKKEREQKALLILAVGMYTREDPGDGANNIYPDSQYAIMSKHCTSSVICNFDDPAKIARALEDLLPAVRG